MASCRSVTGRRLCSSGALFICCLAAATVGDPSVRGETVTASATTRSDVWRKDLPEEGCSDPTSGRRVNIVLERALPPRASSLGTRGAPTVMVAGDVGSVRVNGAECLHVNSTDAASLEHYDWCRAHRSSLGDLWVSFHTRNTTWLGSTANVNLTRSNSGSGGDVTGLQVAVPLANTDAGVLLTYATTRHGGAEAILHVHNGGAADRQLTGAWYDGTPVPGAAMKLPAGGHVVLSLRLATAKAQGDVWTARLEVQGASPAGFGGRIVPERFPVESWPHSDDCSVPGAPGAGSKNAAQLLSYGIDSVYFASPNFASKCGASLPKIIESLAMNATPSFHVVVDMSTAANASLAAQRRVIDAVLIGDEVDGEVDADHLRSKLRDSLDSITAAPATPVYMGSKTNRNVGAFAGIADLQGADAYNAACAPTMLSVLHKLPFFYPYYYLKNARDNTMPLPFWGYSQLYSGWSYQPNSNEIVAQIGQTLLSGSKAMMLFQTVMADFAVQDMPNIASLLRSVRFLGPTLRIGDIGGLQLRASGVTLGEDVAAEAILTPEQVVVVVVNANASGYSNLLCHTEILDRHWTFHKLMVQTLTLDLQASPGVSSLVDWRQIVDGQSQPLEDVTVTAASSSVTLHGMELDDTHPVRLFVASVRP